MTTSLTIRKIILSCATICIIGVTTLLYHKTQTFKNLLLTGARLFTEEKYQRALPFLMSAREKRPADIEAFRYLTETYQKLGRKDKLQETLDETWNVLLKNNNFLRVNFFDFKSFGEAYYQFGDFAKAEYFFRKALKIREEINVKQSLAEVLAWQKKYDEAAKLLNEVISVRPQNVGLPELLADILFWDKKYYQAALAYEKLSHQYSQRYILVKKLADAYRLDGEHEKAIRYYQQYLDVTTE